jgi:hypothetical protein
VLDAGYDEAPLTWDLREHLGQVQILVRLRNDRVLYRDPLPRVPHKAGRPRTAAAPTGSNARIPPPWASPARNSPSMTRATAR